MDYKRIEAARAFKLSTYQYVMVPYILFDYSVLHNVIYKFKTGKGKKGTYNDCIIMADTETSKSRDAEFLDEFGNPDPTPNHVCAWTISIRFFHKNICTLYGTKPSEFVDCLKILRKSLKGDDIYIYFHNLNYDWTFLRSFLIREFGKPVKQLNTKPHYPIYIEFENNIKIKDSLILAGCKLETWAKNLGVEHQKAVGSWDYNKVRDQSDDNFTPEELQYIENDTLAGVECIDAMLISLNKSIYSIQYTATGIPRSEIRERAAKNRGHDFFLSQALTYEQYLKFEKLYHGAYVHANRFFIDETLNREETQGFDFVSSYLFSLIAFKYPYGKFTPFHDCDPEYILENSEKHAFVFKISFINVRLKDNLEPMPALQASKCEQTITCITDNGRILSAGFCTLYICEQDLFVLADQYTWDRCKCTEVEVANKAYLPRWFTDYVFELFEQKCKLKPTKDAEPVKYALAKSRANSCYGMCCQKILKREPIEVIEAGFYQINNEGDTAYFTSGEYREDFTKDPKKEYEKYIKRKTSVLNYQVGVYCTSFAFRQLFELGKCVRRYYRKDESGNLSLALPVRWYYSDTDSGYSDDWDYGKLYQFNARCKDQLKANNYGAVIVDGVEYWLGIAEYDGSYSEFRVLGSKRYCGRKKKTGELSITVAGVPKCGNLCLKDSIENFTKDFIFDGKTTGKLTHYYIFHDIYTDEWGNEIGDSIDLQPCDYLMDAVNRWEFIEEDEIGVEFFGEDSEHFEREFYEI